MLKKCLSIPLFLLLLYFFSSLLSPTFATFIKYPLNPLINIGDPGKWDANLISAPSLVIESDSFKTWYYGSNGPLIGSIGLATSNDGVNWTKYNSNPVLIKDPADSSELEVAEPSIIRVGNEYKAWYLSTTQYTGPGSETYRIKYAKSNDGINWTQQSYVLRRRAGIPWEAEGVASPSTIRNSSGDYMMWYAARDSSGVWRIGFGLSSDGISWNRLLNPVLTATLPWEGTSVASPSILVENGIYHMYYHSGPVVPKYLGHAISSDGIIWIKDSNPILSTGGILDFDKTYIAAPEVVRNSNIIRLYYSGFDGVNWRIGLAEEVLPVPYFSQSDPLWGNDEYDKAGIWAENKNYISISSYGCAITSAAMVLKHFNVQKTPGNPDANPPLPAKDLTPGSLNEWLLSVEDGSFRNGVTNFQSIATMTVKSNNIDPTSPKLEYSSSYNTDSINTALNDKRPAILKLEYLPSPTDMHFVVATGAAEATYYINDPYYDDRKTLSPHYDTVLRVDHFQPANSDFSYLIFAVNPDVNLSLKDENGNEMGIQEIEKPLADLVNGTSSGAGPLKILYFKKPPQGNYTLEISSPENQTYQLDAYLYNSNGVGGLQINTGYSGPNDTDIYQISADSLTFGEITIDTSFQSLKNDINSLFALGQIRKKFVQRLFVLLINHAEDKYPKYPNFSEKFLKDFLRFLEMFRNKYVTAEAYESLKQSVNILINKYTQN